MRPTLSNQTDIDDLKTSLKQLSLDLRRTSFVSQQSPRSLARKSEDKRVTDIKDAYKIENEVFKNRIEELTAQINEIKEAVKVNANPKSICS